MLVSRRALLYNTSCHPSIELRAGSRHRSPSSLFFFNNSYNTLLSNIFRSSPPSPFIGFGEPGQTGVKRCACPHLLTISGHKGWWQNHPLVPLQLRIKLRRTINPQGAVALAKAAGGARKKYNESIVRTVQKITKKKEK
jgi:hypothetical protein